GMVLLKNEGNLLPLDKTKTKSIAIIGPDAYPAVPVGGGSARVQPFAAVSFLEGIGNYLGTEKETYYHRGMPTLTEMVQATNFSTAPVNGQPGLVAEYFTNAKMQGSPAVTRTESRVDSADPGAGIPDQWSSVRWTGYYMPTNAGSFDVLVHTPGPDARYRLFIDNKLILNSWEHSIAAVDYATVSLESGPHKIVLEHFRQQGGAAPRFRLGIVPRNSVVEADAKQMAARADTVVLAVGFDPETEREGSDRTFCLPPGQEQLIQQIAALNHNTVVVITSGGGVD